MANSEIPLFSAAALAILDGMPFDPTARARYDLLSGGLVWPDEFPRSGSSAWAVLGVAYAHRYLVAYRASITLGEEREGLRPLWQQVLTGAPGWPGLRPERHGKRARRRLLAGQRLQSRCLEELEQNPKPGVGRA